MDGFWTHEFACIGSICCLIYLCSIHILLWVVFTLVRHYHMNVLPFLAFDVFLVSGLLLLIAAPLLCVWTGRSFPSSTLEVLLCQC